MSISQEIQRIKTNIANAYTQANEKGATLPEQQNSANLASTIESIQTGGSAELEDLVETYGVEDVLETAGIDDVQNIYSLKTLNNRLEIEELENSYDDFFLNGEDIVQKEDANIKSLFNPTSILDVGIFSRTLDIVDDVLQEPLGIYIVSTSSIETFENGLWINFEYMRNRYFSKFIGGFVSLQEIEANNKYYYVGFFDDIQLSLKEYFSVSSADVSDLKEEYFVNYYYEAGEEGYEPYSDIQGFADEEHSDAIFVRENEVYLEDIMSANFWRKVNKVIFSTYFSPTDVDINPYIQ